MQAAMIRSIHGQPAVIAAAVIGSVVGTGVGAPILMSVKFIAGGPLSVIAEQLQLTHLRSIGPGTVPAGDHVYDLEGPRGGHIARFAWTPKQPGAEIVHSVIPFIAVALAGFALLAAFVLRYMRRTAAAIAVGETRLRHLAMHDPLCGLPNRIFFGERLQAVIDQVRNGSTPAAVFYIDLDHFKDVNDTLGHPIGDELIRDVTLRLSRTLRGDDLVARLGGDEFAVISSIGDDTAKITSLAQRIINTICAPYSINGQNILIGASIGIAVIDRNCAGAADIMRYADMALYRAKNEGRNRACIYDAAMDADLSSRKLLEADLREAIEHDRLQLHYQPIVSKDGETMLGVEALCRWTDPERGEIPPSEFIPVAERSGLIIELGAWVLRRACIDGKAWPGLSVAVNVSSLQFRRIDFVDMVERTLDRDPIRSGAARTGTDRERAARQCRYRGSRNAAAEGARRQDRARRFRHRLFQPALSAPLSLRQAQDRPQLRALDRKGVGRRGHRARGGQPRPRPRHAGDGGRRGDRRPAAVPARGRRAFHARLPLRQGGAGRRDQRAPAPPRRLQAYRHRAGELSARRARHGALCAGAV